MGTALLQYLIIFVLVVVLVSFTAQKLFELMGRAVEQELLEMRVETQEAGSVFKTKDSMQYRVREHRPLPWMKKRSASSRTTVSTSRKGWS